MIDTATISTITEYIASCPVEQQNILQDLRETILQFAPDGTTEMINYKMPTFRFNGNLIHFASYQKHIGLYPGSAAITQFEEELKSYKTSKGAIQIPVGSPLPKDLIKKLIDFNTEILKNKQGPNWHNHRSKWHEFNDFMQQLLSKTILVKEFKWGSDIYTYKGKNVIGWNGFKNFFSLWFYYGVFIRDEYKVLISGSEGKTKKLRQWRFTKIEEMDKNKILAYIDESIAAIEAGKEIKTTTIAEIKPEGLLKEALEQNPDLNIAFQKLTPGKRKKYLAYLQEAKQAKTKSARLDKIMPLILEGKGLNDKYKR